MGTTRSRLNGMKTTNAQISPRLYAPSVRYPNTYWTEDTAPMAISSQITEGNTAKMGVTDGFTNDN